MAKARPQCGGGRRLDLSSRLVTALTFQSRKSHLNCLFWHSPGLTSFEAANQTIFRSPRPLLASFTTSVAGDRCHSSRRLVVEQWRVLRQREPNKTCREVRRGESRWEELEDELMESEQLEMGLTGR